MEDGAVCLDEKRVNVYVVVSGLGMGSILDTVLKDTEDTAHSCILSVSNIHFQPTFINGICI